MPRISRVRIWEYPALFVDKAPELRVPKDKYPTDGPVALKQVDEATGHLTDPFAVEEPFRAPRLPLREQAGVYLSNPGDSVPVTSYATFAPLKDFVPPDGVPVVKLSGSKCPKQWLVTDVLKSR